MKTAANSDNQSAANQKGNERLPRSQRYEAAFAAVTTFVISAIVQTALTYFSFPAGEITIFDPVSTEGARRVSIISIENYSQKALPPVELAIPRTTPSSQIYSSFPIAIRDVPELVGHTDQRIVQVQGLPAQSRTAIAINVIAGSTPIVATNAADLGLSTATGSQSSRRYLLAVIQVLGAACFYALVVYIFAYLLWDRLESVRIALSSAKADSTELRESLETVKSEAHDAIRATELRLQRYQTVLLVRLRDHARELDFWRQTIRKLLFDETGTRTADATISQVTQALKTYSTVKSVDEFKSIDMLMQLVDATRIHPKPLR